MADDSYRIFIDLAGGKLSQFVQIVSNRTGSLENGYAVRIDNVGATGVDSANLRMNHGLEEIPKYLVVCAASLIEAES